MPSKSICCTLSINSTPLFYTPGVFAAVMNDLQINPRSKWCKNMFDAMNIPKSVVKDLASGKRSYTVNQAKETVEIPVTQKELDEAVALSQRSY